MGKFLDGALKPGSTEFVVVLNTVLAVLFSVMLWVVYTELEDSIHMFIMLFIIVGLAVSINVFIMQANQLKNMPVDEAAASSTTAKGKGKTSRVKTD